MPIFVDDTEAVNEKVNSFSAFISTKIIIDEKENKIFIKGINYTKFLIRIKDMYETKSVNKLFTKNYTPFTQKLWEKKKIPGYKRKVTNLEVDLFFASELYNILMQLADYYNLRYYRRMAEYIKKNTYLDNLDKNIDVKVDINRLNSILNEDYKPKDFQEEFIKKYFEYKEIYDLDGYILSFDQGLGKTFTAACISELIHPDQTIIVCMNTLKENWANELRLYFKKYNDIERFKREVYVYGVSKPKEYSNDTRYIIVNNESINKIFPLVKNTNSTMIIVDECQNFRNLDSLQTKNMLKLKQITKSKDNLMMSGTPIKANPSEIVPAMMMIDRTFTLDLAKLYIKAFTSNTDTLSDVVQTRFNRTIYRKTKDQVLDLPSKTVTNFKLEYKDEDPYLMINVKKRVADRFQEILESYKDEVDSVKDEFRETTLKYSSQDRTTTLDYIKFVDKGQDYESVHDSLYDLYDGFIKNNVYPNIKDKDELKRYKYVVSVYVYITQKCFFLAMGEVLPKIKAKAFNELYDNNKDLIYKMINNNPKKTVIFSTIVEVVDHICDDLNKNDIKAVKITGSVKNRMNIINQFREDDTVDVLVATSQTMGTGVTLVEANQMMVFCPPYRKADFDQACDRIYRIGQTHPVNIYNVIGSTSSKDITTRMTDILDWSDQMVSSVLDNIVNEEALIEKYKGDDNNMVIFEEAVYDSKHTEPVYIVLMHTGTLLANTIKAVTKDEFSHSCISFNSKLDPMFSFGNKKTSYIGGEPGFVKQNTKDEFFKKKKAVYEIYVMFVSKHDKAKMIERLKWFREKDKYLGYDFIGLIKYKLGISSDDNLKKWFCSRFVAELLGQAENLGRDASLFSPQDFKNDLNFISLVCKGDDLYNYDYKITERNLKKIKDGDHSYNESNTNMGIIEKALLEMDDTHRRKGVTIDQNKSLTPEMKKIMSMYGLLASDSGYQKDNIYSTTSQGKDVIDSKIQTKIEYFDKEKAKAIIESEDIVKEYNKMINGTLKEIMEDSDITDQSIEGTVRSIQRLNTNGGVIGHATTTAQALRSGGISDDQVEKYIKGVYFYETDNPQAIKLLLQLRIKYNQKIVNLMRKAIECNYKILGYTESEAKLLLKDLDDDSNKSNSAIGKIKKDISANREKFIKNNGDCIDLTSLGFGKIFMSNGKGNDLMDAYHQINNADNASQALDNYLQKAMTHDAVVICHGNSDGTDWIMQPIRTDKSGKTFTNMNEFVQELIKEGYRKILIGVCNPGSHKLSKDTYSMMVKTHTVVNYSDFSNLVESVFEYDMSDNMYIQLLEYESQLICLSEEYGVDYNSIDCDKLEDFLNNGMTISESLALNEATLSSKERKSLPDKTFGLPEKRKFPLNDYDHVVLAIKFFNRCDKKDQEELAKNIIKAMKVYKVSADKIGKNNKLRNYINGSLKEYAIREGIGNLFKYKTERKEIPPKVQKKDAINKAYQIGDKLLNSEKYRSIKKYVKKVFTDKDQYAAFLKGEENDYHLYTYKVPDNAQGRRDMFGPKFNEKEDNDYDWVDDSLIYKFDDELIKQIKQMDDCYSVSDDDNELYEGDFYLVYHKKIQKIKVNKKTGEVIKESVLNEGLFKKDLYKDAIKKYRKYNPSRPDCNKTMKDIESTLVDDIAKNIRTKLIKVENNEDDTVSVIFKTDKVSGLNKRCFDAVIRSKGVTLLNESYKLITIKYKDCILLVSTSDEDDDDIESTFRIDLSVLYCKEYSSICKISTSSIEALCKNVNITYTSLVNPAFVSFSVAGGGNAYADKYPNIEKNTGCKIIPKSFTIYVFSNNMIHESVGVPVVGLTNKTPVIVDNMYNNAFTSLEMDEKIIRNCMMSSTKALLNKEDKFYVPYIPYIQESLNIDPNIGFYRDRNGIFVMNENTKLRSPSYNDVDDIDDRTILYITYGELNDSKLNDL